MKFRRLGKTNLRVSVIGLGTWQLGGEWGKTFDQAEVNQMFDAARQEGINLIDTAECYGDHESERLVGGAIKPDRQKWIVATKFGHLYDGPMKRRDARTAADARKQFEDSLKVLDTDFIDILQYHSIRDSEFENDELSEVLRKLVQSGKVLHIGNSVAQGLDNVPQIQNSTRRGVEMVQIVYNRLDRKPEQASLELCIEQDLGVMARVPLASGFLSGKYKPGVTFSTNDIRSERDRKSVDDRLREVDRIARTEVPPGVSMAHWALAWCLKHPAVTCVIPGCKDFQQVKENAAGAKLVSEDHPQAWK